MYKEKETDYKKNSKNKKTNRLLKFTHYILF